MEGKKKSKDYIIAAVLILVIGGAIAGFGFYQDEVTSFFRLQGWDLSPVTRETEKFLQAANKNDGAAVEAMLGPNIPRIEPIKRNNKLWGFKFQIYGGTKDRSLRDLAPDAAVKPGSPKIAPLEGGAVEIQTSYKAHYLDLRWNKLPQGWRVINITFTEK